MARNLRSQKTGIIGVFIADMTDSVYVSSSHIILRELHARGLCPLLTVAEIGLDLCRREWLQNNIEGLILCGTTQEMTSDFFRDIRKQDIATVIAGCAYRDPNSIRQLPRVSTVSLDNNAGMRLAIDHLIQQKRKRIAHLTGPSWHADAYERKNAYITMIQEYHIPIIKELVPNQPLWKSGYLSASELIKADQAVDAIIAYGDEIAIGAMKWLIENKVNIPVEVAVVGFDNSPQSEFSTPPLTSVAQPFETIGKESVDLLENSLYTASKIEKIQIKPSLIIRRSS
jgi:DNA-binding LacI/PurR family transcriptional regulator